MTLQRRQSPHTWTEVDSPVGPLRLVALEGALAAVEFLGEMPDGPSEAASVRLHAARAAARAAAVQGVDADDVAMPAGVAATGVRADGDPVLVAAAEQLASYFAGERTDFDLPLDPVGTPFQQEVWAALRQIPYGETASYGEIAGRLGRTGNGARAVGVANGRNPIPVIVPCHRVVGASGAMTGYAGGMERKRTLLELEGALTPGSLVAAAQRTGKAVGRGEDGRSVHASGLAGETFERAGDRDRGDGLARGGAHRG